MTSTEVYPTTAPRPSSHTDEPSAWTSLYADTSVPPTRTYDVVRDPSTDQSQDVSSGFGGSIGTAPIVEPTTTARAVPFMAEPPLVVYSNTSTPTSISTRNETGRGEAGPSGNAPPTVSSLYEDEDGGTSQGTSSLGTPTISDQEESASRDVGAGGNEVKGSPRESGAEVKQKPKGLLSRLNKLFRKSVTESRAYGSC